MDYMAFFSDRLARIEKHLSTFNADRKYALGRVLEVEALAFSLRNAELLSVKQFDQIDLQSETLRRRFQLHADYSDKLRAKPYNGRFLEPQSGYAEEME